MNRIGGEAAAASLYAPVVAELYCLYTSRESWNNLLKTRDTDMKGSEMNHDLAYVDAKHMNTCLCREMLI